jgi:hypothetical protein
VTGGTDPVVDAAIYGAIAGVAAITTALQSVVALQPLRSAIDIGRRKRSSSRGQAQYNDAKHDAGRDFFILLALNVIAAGINGSVLAAWWKVGVAEVSPRDWEFWVPWLAVTLGSTALLITAALSIMRLGSLAWRT